VRRTNGATCSIKELATPEQIEEVRSTLLPRSYGYYMRARLQEAGHDDVMRVNWREYSLLRYACYLETGFGPRAASAFLGDPYSDED
jgi:hypothetical protein